MAEVLTVSALNRYVKTVLDSNDLLFDLALQGEISNFVRNARSGHCYFTLRDAQCSVKAVMFKGDARRISFQPEDGMRVIVRCRVTLYERDGAFQIYVSDMFPDGIGSAQLAFEQLKAKLQAEGLFDPALKKPIPSFPKCIGVVTSKTGAALQDIINVLSRRWPLTHLLLCPVNVQGFEAAGQIAAAIRALDESNRPDVIVVARGGGSREDLWVFNAEVIARAAFACKTPLISAIGHEIDFTILDFVADLRAPTPSAAAELAVPDCAELRQIIFNFERNIQNNMQNRLSMCYNEMAVYPRQVYSAALNSRISAETERLTNCTTLIKQAVAKTTQDAQKNLEHHADVMAALNPYHVLARGYTMLRSANGQILAMSDLTEGQQIQIVGTDQVAVCTVNSLEECPDENA